MSNEKKKLDIIYTRSSLEREEAIKNGYEIIDVERDKHVLYKKHLHINESYTLINIKNSFAEEYNSLQDVVSKLEELEMTIEEVSELIELGKMRNEKYDILIEKRYFFEWY